jgi:hypothetical protein
MNGSRKTLLVGATLILMLAGLTSGCVKAQITGTYDGEWSGGSSDEVTVTSDGAGLLLVECDDCVIDEEIDGEIEGGGEFTIDETNVDYNDGRNTSKVDIEGEGEVDAGELTLEVEITFPNGAVGEDEFEGDKE